MAKADKLQVKQRISEVLRLLVSGASGFDLKRYAESREWNVSPRQLQRYLKSAYREMERGTQGKRRQLRAKHLLQREQLFTRACKEGDIATSLHVLKDSAKLQGLYPGKEPKSRAEKKSQGWQSKRSSLSTLDRLASYLQAEEAGDQVQMRLVDDSSPYLRRMFVDFRILRLILERALQLFMGRQMEYLAQWSCLSIWTDDSRSRSKEAAMLRAHLAGLSYEYKVCHLAWCRILRRFNLNRNYVTRNLPGRETLATYHRVIFDAAPTLEKLTLLRKRAGWPSTGLPTVRNVARKWYRALRRSFDQWSVKKVSSAPGENGPPSKRPILKPKPKSTGTVTPPPSAQEAEGLPSQS